MVRPSKKAKGYWEKRKESFSSMSDAKARAGTLRTQQHISHVVVDKKSDEYVVAYSVAKWYIEEAQKAGIKI
jgi:hypothetical protein